jgi:hypothetical protein
MPCRDSTDMSLTGFHLCSAYLISIADIIRHWFLNPVFAKFAGTRTRAFVDSPYYRSIDDAMGGALSRARGEPAAPSVGGDPAGELFADGAEPLVLDIAIAADGVQLHQKSLATTAIVVAKCLSLPCHLVHTLMASYNFAFIGGPKEPTTLSDFIAIVLRQFALCEPEVHYDENGNSVIWRFMLLRCSDLRCAC